MTWRATRAAAALALLAGGAASAAERPKLVVLELSTAGGVDAQTAAAVTDAIAAEVSRGGYFEVFSSKDVATTLGLERQRQLLGCSEEGACLTELAGALGARFVMTGSLARLGESFQLTVQAMDSRTARPVGRSARFARSLDALRALMPSVVAEACGTPPPAPPSHALAYAIIGAGALAVVGGGVTGLQALSTESAVAAELKIGATDRLALKPDAYYRGQAQVVSQQKALALTAMGVGAAAIGVGIFLNPRDASGSSLALIPTAGGVAVVGAFR